MLIVYRYLAHLRPYCVHICSVQAYTCVPASDVCIVVRPDPTVWLCIMLAPPCLVRLRPLNTRVLLCRPITLCRLTTEYSLNASVQTSVDDVSRVDKKVGSHSKVCGIDAASIFSLYFWRTAIFFRILRIVTFFISPYSFHIGFGVSQ